MENFSASYLTQRIWPCFGRKILAQSKQDLVRREIIKGFPDNSLYCHDKSIIVMKMKSAFMYRIWSSDKLGKHKKKVTVSWLWLVVLTFKGLHFHTFIKHSGSSYLSQIYVKYVLTTTPIDLLYISCYASKFQIK